MTLLFIKNPFSTSQANMKCIKLDTIRVAKMFLDKINHLWFANHYADISQFVSLFSLFE